MRQRQSLRGTRLLLTLSGIVAASCFAAVGCNSTATGPPDGTTDGTDGSAGDDGNVLLNDALGYEGSISGKVLDSQSTRDSIETGDAAQALPPDFDTDNTVVQFTDLVGDNLLDPEGNPIPPVPLDPDGSFAGEGLPVGTDFTICVDIESDGVCDIEAAVNIPSRSGGDEGELAGVRVDPLTTLVCAKLRNLIEQHGIDPADLPVSPVAVVTRIVAAYTHLFEDAGIDRTLTLDDLEGVTRDQFAALFDSIVPPGARSGVAFWRE